MQTLTMDQSSRLLDAVHLATRKLASLDDLDVVLQEVLQICVEAVGAEGGTVYIHDPATHTIQFRYVIPGEAAKGIQMWELADDFGVAGKVFQSGKLEITNAPPANDNIHKEIRQKTGIRVRTMITVPLQIADLPPVGVVQLINKSEGLFTEQDAMVLDTVSDVSTLAIMHSRLMEQSAQVASLRGMGRAAHDLSNKAGALMTVLPEFEQTMKNLRTSLTDAPTRAETLVYINELEKSYSEFIQPYTERVYRFARLVNDLAAGKPLEPKKKLQSFPRVVHNGIQYMESQARRSNVLIRFDLQENVPEFEFDDLYIARIAENLVGNAIKAVAEMIPDEWLNAHANDLDATFSDVVVKTRYAKGAHTLEVSDKGPGMYPAHIRRILRGEARSEWGKASGSGLGTKIVIELAATHGGRVAIDSALGYGTTFRVTIPEKMP